MRNGRALRDDEKATIIAMREEGETFADIARAIGRGHTTPQRYLSSVGEHEPHRPPSAETRARIVEWYGDGRPVAVILRRFCIRESTLYGILHTAGEPLRYPNMSAAAKTRARRRHKEAQGDAREMM